MRDNLTIFIGGEAGQGLATVGELMAQLLCATGFNFLTFQGYHSRIRGGHNTFAIKIFQQEISGPDDGADIVLSLNEDTDILDAPRLRKGGLLLSVSAEASSPSRAEKIQVPFDEISSPRNRNMLAFGILVSLLNLSVDKAQEVVKSNFKDKSGPALETMEKGIQWASGFKGRYECNAAGSGGRLLINGNTALALGAAAGGVNFCSFYPMTPGTSVALALASWATSAGLIVEQAEDEIAAINMALGASYAGAVPLVSTSGGGFALMCEGVSLSGMTETPVVLVVVQRPGPATGLPTRTEQGDLNLVLYSGHGEFPRAILAPSSAEECFQLGARAAWLAEESQGPVFILSDQFLADRQSPVTPFDLDKIPEAVNPLKTHEKNIESMKMGENYLRYKISDSDGLSPKLLPGFSRHLVKVDSDEHSQDGHLTEDLAVRVEMQNKRLKKENWLNKEVLPPSYYGSSQPDILLVTWGSTLGAALDSLEILHSHGEKAAVLHFNQLYPLNPEDWLDKMEQALKVVFVESNSTGQFSALVRRETGFKAAAHVLRYDGLPLTAEYIIGVLSHIKEVQ